VSIFFHNLETIIFEIYSAFLKNIYAHIDDVIVPAILQPIAGYLLPSLPGLVLAPFVDSLCPTLFWWVCFVFRSFPALSFFVLSACRVPILFPFPPL
jgi:hypothetical protein